MDLNTPEEIASHYRRAMDSVTVINELMAKDERDAEEVDKVNRNVTHLEVMVAKDFWTTEDLSPFNDAIAAGKA